MEAPDRSTLLETANARYVRVSICYRDHRSTWKQGLLTPSRQQQQQQQQCLSNAPVSVDLWYVKDDTVDMEEKDTVFAGAPQPCTVGTIPSFLPPPPPLPPCFPLNWSPLAISKARDQATV